MFSPDTCLVLIASVLSGCVGEEGTYPCICSNAVEKTVYQRPNASSEPVGYMYEFDCKPLATEYPDVDGFHVLQYEHQLGYLEEDVNQLEEITCTGDTEEDILTTTPKGLTTTTTTTMPTTTPFTKWQQAANVSGFEFQYIGIGYNLLDANPERNHDPGFQLDRRILQLSGVRNKVAESSLYKNSSCIMSVLDTVIQGSKSLQQEMNNFVRSSESHSNDVMSEAYTYDPDFWESRKYLDSGSQLYVDEISTCKLTTVQYRSETDLQYNYVISRDYATDVCQLPLTLNNKTLQDYLLFMDNWGTSIVMSADLGTRNLSRYTTTRADLVQYLQNKNPSVVMHAGPFEGYTSSLVLDTTRFIAGSRDLGSTPEIIRGGSVSEQVVIGLDVVPVAQFIDWKYFEPVLQLLKSEGVCSDSLSESDIKTLHDNMEQMADEYVDYRNKQTGYIHSHPVNDFPVQIPVTWPLGTYGLIKSSDGCPHSKVDWVSGWVDQDTDDVNQNNTFSPDINLYLKGLFGDDSIRTEFCMKNSPTVTSFDTQWPNGTYCVLKNGDCPAGFKIGSIQWDDENTKNGNLHSKTTSSLPDGQFGIDTLIYFCCRDDGSVLDEMTLPIDRSFVLLRYGTTCQTVYGMAVTDVFVDWTTDNEQNMDRTEGMHPFDDGEPEHHRLHFCHYRDYSDGISVEFIG